MTPPKNRQNLHIMENKTTGQAGERTQNIITITARARAFSGESVREHKFYVDLSDGGVLVWDSVAGHYTNCNSLSAAAKKRILNLAKAIES